MLVKFPVKGFPVVYGKRLSWTKVGNWGSSVHFLYPASRKQKPAILAEGFPYPFGPLRFVHHANPCQLTPMERIDPN